MECVGNRFRPHMMYIVMYIVYHIILDMSIFVEVCKKIAKISMLLKNSSILNAEHHKGEKDENCRRYYKQNIYLSK